MQLSNYAKQNSDSHSVRVERGEERLFFFMGVHELVLTDCYMCKSKPKVGAFDHVVVYEIPGIKNRFDGGQWAKSVIPYQRYVEIINTDFDLFELSIAERSDLEDKIKVKGAFFGNGFRSGNNNIVFGSNDIKHSSWWIHCFEYLPRAECSIKNLIVFQMGIE
jgi:hypothetical protein